MGHAGPGGGDGVQGRVAGGAGRASGDRKDRQHAVAHEFQHFAPVRVHGAGDAVEPGVKRRDHRRRRLGFGEGGEAAEIG